METTLSTESLLENLKSRFHLDEHGVFQSNVPTNYWSNLDKAENDRLIEKIKTLPALTALRETHPALEPVIYSPKRQAGLELLDLKGNEICIDYGCMWGALTIPLAKRTRYVLGVDQTMHSLRFLKARMQESGCDNIALLNHDLRTFPVMEKIADVAIINGVLEWIPEEGNVEIKQYIGRRQERRYMQTPRNLQLDFLKRVYTNLKPGGKLYLAIENRYDFRMFFGAPDPHSRLLFTAIAPRRLADWISKTQVGRPYVNWIYSPRELKHLLRQAGFGQIGMHACFPEYRYPEYIIPFESRLRGYLPADQDPSARTVRHTIARLLDYLTYRVMGWKSLAPSLIAVAMK